MRRSCTTPPCHAALPALLAGGAALAVSEPAHACPPGIEQLVEQTSSWWDDTGCAARRDGSTCLDENHESYGRLPVAVRRESRRRPEATRPLVGTPVVFGDMEAAPVRDVIALHADDLARCHERADAAKPRKHGMVRATFRIAATGETTDVVVHGANKIAAACVTDVIDAATYDAVPDREDIEVRIALKFLPEDTP